MMKKILSLAAALVLVLSLAACGNSAAGSSAGSANATPDIADATELLSEIWNAHGEDQKFPVTGGDYDNMVDDEPGKVNAEDGDTMNSLFGFPPEMVDKIDDAASLMHMMNANTFTAAAYHVKNSGDLETVAKALRDNIQARHWMCGFPEKLIVMTIDSYVVTVYGDTDLCDTFKGHAENMYPVAKTAYEEAIQ